MSRLFFKILEFFLIVPTGERPTRFHTTYYPDLTEKVLLWYCVSVRLKIRSVRCSHRSLFVHVWIYCADAVLTSFTLSRFATRGFLGWDCSPLDIINYSTFDGVCQVFFSRFWKKFRLTGDWKLVPRAVACAVISLLTLSIIANSTQITIGKLHKFREK